MGWWTWVFSGIGATAIGLGAAWLMGRSGDRRQRIKAGDRSHNLQAGRDIVLGHQGDETAS